MTRSSDQPIVMPRIAIPMPHSGDRDYAERSVTQYENAVRLAGGEPVRIELDQSSTKVRKQIEHCDAVLLPGSRADVDPQKYNALRHEKTIETDARRDAVDCLLLEDQRHTSGLELAECVEQVRPAASGQGDRVPKPSPRRSLLPAAGQQFDLVIAPDERRLSGT